MHASHRGEHDAHSQLHHQQQHRAWMMQHEGNLGLTVWPWRAVQIVGLTGSCCAEMPGMRQDLVWWDTADWLVDSNYVEGMACIAAFTSIRHLHRLPGTQCSSRSASPIASATSAAE